MSGHSYDVIEVIAGLMHKPRTASQLTEYTGLWPDTVSRMLASLKAAGLAYRAGSLPKEPDEEGRIRKGKREVLWALQDKPHARTDAVNRHGVPI